jgi:hypothetical protein
LAIENYLGKEKAAELRGQALKNRLDF